MNNIGEQYKAKDYYNLPESYFVVIKKILENISLLLPPLKSALDVGCGIGAWLKVLKDIGVEDVVGLEGKWIEDEALVVYEKEFIVKDLEKRFDLERKFDLVLCLEVAEHLSEERADTFIEDLTIHGDLILFSAAISLQGGRHHVNEQFPDYWINKFQSKGFGCVDVRDRIKKYCTKQWWYGQNLFLFLRESEKEKYPLLADKIIDSLEFIYLHKALIPRYKKLVDSRKEEENDITKKV